MLGALAAVVGALATLGVVGSDEDDGADAAQLKQVGLVWQVRVFEGVTEFRRVDLRSVPSESRISLRCEGDRCFTGIRRRDVPEAAPTVPLRRLTPRLVAGARLEIRLAHADLGTKIWTLVMRRNAIPRMEVNCIRLDAALPGPC